MTLSEGLSVVVPLYNEAEVVSQLAARLIAVLNKIGKNYEIIFVDDASTDATVTAIHGLIQQHSSIKLVRLSRNSGQTAALAAGIDHAQLALILTMDGDLQHLPEEIPNFLDAMTDQIDIVSGMRIQRQDNVLMRRLPSWAANALMRQMSGMQVQDFGSTFKLYRSSLLKKLELFGDLHRFIPVLAQREGARIVEIPISVQARAFGKSHYGISRTFGVFTDIVFLHFYLKFLSRPMRLFGGLFFVCFGLGFLISFGLMLLWCIGSVSAVAEHSALLLLSVFLMIMGVVFLVSGILAELLSRVYFRTSGNKIYSLRN